MLDAEDTPKVKITAGGQTYTIDLAKDFTAIDGRLFREQHGFGIFAGLQQIQEPDVMATYVWLYRRKSNPALDWIDVASQITVLDTAKSLRDEPATDDGDDGGGGGDDADPS